MTDKHPKRPRDPNQLAKSIVDIATGDLPDSTESTRPKQTAADYGRAGGLKGGKARASALTPEQRKQIALKAAAARWRNDG